MGELADADGVVGVDVPPIPAPAVPGLLPCDADNVFSLSTIKSRSICLRRYSSGIHTSLDTLDLDVCDPARLDLDLPMEPGGAAAGWAWVEGEDECLELALAFGLELELALAFGLEVVSFFITHAE